jgi:hypothetical protein
MKRVNRGLLGGRAPLRALISSTSHHRWSSWGRFPCSPKAFVNSPRWRVLRPGVLAWSVLVGVLLVAPRWVWGQSHAPNEAPQSIGAPVRVGPLLPEQLEELKGRPLCVYNFTSW